MIFRILKWIWRGWPVLVWFLIIAIHQISSQMTCIELIPCLSNQEVDRWLSLILNITGGILVLYSIDSNLGLFRHGGIPSVFLRWLRAFPLLKGESVSISVGPAEYKVTMGTPRIEITKKPETVEELYSYVKAQVAYLKADIEEQRNHTDQIFNKLDKKVSHENVRLSSQINEINLQLQAVAIGGFKLQLFGVLLLIYAAIVGF